MSMRGVLAKCRAGDQGFAMISVVLFGVVLLSVTLMTVTQVQQATHRGTGHVSFEREIHLAETGVDRISVGALVGWMACSCCGSRLAIWRATPASEDRP